MSTLRDIRPSILQLEADEVMEIHRIIRQSRRTPKRKKKVAKEKKAARVDIGKMSAAELDVLIKQLEDSRR